MILQDGDQTEDKRTETKRWTRGQRSNGGQEDGDQTEDKRTETERRTGRTPLSSFQPPETDFNSCSTCAGETFRDREEEAAPQIQKPQTVSRGAQGLSIAHIWRP